MEIDLVIERPGMPILLVEIKSNKKVSESDAKSLETLGVDIDKNSERILLSCDTIPQKFGGTKAYYWIDGIDKIFGQSRDTL